MQYLPPDVAGLDDASNNKWLISGKGSLIMNPPSAWAVAKRDAPQVAEKCWTHGMPKGPQGRFVPFLPRFLAIWKFCQEQVGGQEPHQGARPAQLGREAGRRQPGLRPAALRQAAGLQDLGRRIAAEGLDLPLRDARRRRRTSLPARLPRRPSPCRSSTRRSSPRWSFATPGARRWRPRSPGHSRSAKATCAPEAVPSDGFSRCNGSAGTSWPAEPTLCLPHELGHRATAAACHHRGQRPVPPQSRRPAASTGSRAAWHFGNAHCSRAWKRPCARPACTATILDTGRERPGGYSPVSSPERAGRHHGERHAHGSQTRADDARCILASALRAGTGAGSASRCQERSRQRASDHQASAATEIPRTRVPFPPLREGQDQEARDHGFRGRVDPERRSRRGSRSDWSGSGPRSPGCARTGTTS